ncbi:hypothetical protein [Roseateles sp. LYH14W]|uniref:DUF2946 domain-containing protein n=1 Tax=Pelomonas parva TaxID=3299032 RepID=A0ABW7F685_9BURK
MRAGLLMLLLVVLPLQGVLQLAVSLQGQRHVHTGAVHDASPSPLRVLLDRLHPAQDLRLQGHRPAWVVSHGAAAEEHEHGGVRHSHTAADTDVLAVGDPADEAAQGGATAFLAWLPAPLALPMAAAGAGRPATADADWRGRIIAPPLAPPRG